MSKRRIILFCVAALIIPCLIWLQSLLRVNLFSSPVVNSSPLDSLTKGGGATIIPTLGSPDTQIPPSNSSSPIGSTLRLVPNIPRAFTLDHQPKTSLEPVSSQYSATSENLPLEQKAQMIQESLDLLATGTFFHNFPPKLRANVPQVIEAGMTEQVTEELRQRLQGQGNIITRDKVPYDPLGINILLKADENFVVEDLITGQRPPIVNGTATIWRWKITPKKRGLHYVTLTALVRLNVPQLDRSYDKELVLYKEPVDVQVNPVYSLLMLLIHHGLTAFFLSLCTLFGIFAWYKALWVHKKSTPVISDSSLP
jgi:hypothetical protein